MSTKLSNTKLIIDEQALEKLGLHSEAIWIVEYDMPSRFPLTKEQKKTMNKEQVLAYERFKKLARVFRNNLVYTLKFNLNASKLLESNWLIEGDKLEQAVSAIEGIKADMKNRGRGIKEFEDADERIKIIPIFTTNEGFENYQSKKAEFILDFILEHVHYIEDGLKTKRISQSTLWRSKKAVEICNAHIDSMKNNERFNELTDSLNMLDEMNGQMEAIVLEVKEQIKANKEKSKKD